MDFYLTPKLYDYRNSPTQVIEDVKSILAFNSLLITLSKHPDQDRFIRGLGPISLGTVIYLFEIIC